MKLVDFLRNAYKHRIEVDHKKFWIGVVIIITSWQLIAFGISIHTLLLSSWLASLIDFSIQMLVATLFIFIISVFNGLIRDKNLKGYQILKIKKDNEVIKDSQVRHLSFKERIAVIYARAAFATSGYFLFELARIFIGAIDNSTLHGADALIYALIFGWWIDKSAKGFKSYTSKQWIGMGISASAILFAFIYELFITTPSLALGGVTEGVVSSIMLSVIILISSIVVYHDSVIRIAFHNCLFGFIASFIVILISVLIKHEGKFSDIITTFRLLNLKSTMLVGLSYGLALLGFLQSYRFIEPILIAMSGNALGVGTIVMAMFFKRSELNLKDVILTALLIVGSFILGLEEWRKDSNEKANKTIL